jgi:3-hydroxybutyryl-CoA dehydratase
MKEAEKKELLYDDMVKGMQLPEVTVTLRPEILEEYLEGIDDLNPLYLDEDYAKDTPFGGRIAPPISIAMSTTVSNFIKPLDRKIPPGLIHAKQRFEFTGIMRPHDELVFKTMIEDKYEKKGRKFAVLRSEVFNQKGERVATSWLTPIWPK